MATSQFTRYQSSDAGAPTLTGSAGSLINVLTKCLVSGYGSQTGAGWSIPYSTTNIAAFQQGTSVGTSIYGKLLYVDESTTATQEEARIVGFDTMSSITVGSGAFPTTSQGLALASFIVSQGLIARKSATADSTTIRNWICFADSRTFYFMVLTGDIAGLYFSFCFGDFYSLASGDTSNCFIMGRVTASTASSTVEYTASGSFALSSPLPGHYIDRTYTGSGSSIAMGKAADLAKGQLAVNYSYQTIGNSGAPSPNPVDNSFYTSHIWVIESSAGTIRGRMRGLWQLCHPYTSFSDGQQFTGANDVSGKSFEVHLQLCGYSGNSAQYQGSLVFEISATVETN